MTAFVIGHIHVRDAERWQDYLSKVGATISKYGGVVELRGAQTRILSVPRSGRGPDPSGTAFGVQQASTGLPLVAGQHPFERVVLIKFADQAAANHWHDSPEYQQLVACRDAAADVTLISYQV